MDLATHWIEFVIRHKGAPHLRNPGLSLYWYQHYYIDVLCITIIGVIIIYLLFSYMKRLCFTVRKNNKEKTQ